ncbi:glycosyltransferase family 2 protein [Pontibacter sp. H249]|uniref:glycosyltransferase family 2 protein n=1 Tax=Pontibacter sp. H249 TaxID=3133420 RepID=UPI0030BDB7E6
MKVSFVILTWNRYKFLERCIQELVNSIDDELNSEIIVMDNGSTDKTPEVLNRFVNNNLVKIIRRKKNYGLNAYKKLFKQASGEYVVIVDDDVLNFPKSVDKIFIDYMTSFQDYGFLALNVIQNEFTNGAKPEPSFYVDDTKEDKTIEQGPTGGWCSCFRVKDYSKIRLRFLFTNLNMKRGEDGLITKLLYKKLGLKSGIIKKEYCFHACGPYYAKEFGHLDREIEKYKNSGLKNFIDIYKQYK